jgi:hypothetical protein
MSHDRCDVETLPEWSITNICADAGSAQKVPHSVVHATFQASSSCRTAPHDPYLSYCIFDIVEPSGLGQLDSQLDK